MLNAQRPFFNLAALHGEYRFGSTGLEKLSGWMDMAQREPWRAMEFELAMESVIRNAGFDPNQDNIWEKNGFASRTDAASQIAFAYAISVPGILEHGLNNDLKFNAANFAPAALELNEKPTFLNAMVENLMRAHAEDSDPHALQKDESWKRCWENNGEEGYGVAGVHQRIQEAFKALRIGGFVAYQAGITNQDMPENMKDELSALAADYYFRHAFPEGADHLGLRSKEELQLAIKEIANQVAPSDVPSLHL